MGCAGSTEGDLNFEQPLSEDLENQLRVVSFDKQDHQIERFESNKP